MCDYSAENVDRRDAKEGDTLVSRIIAEHGSHKTVGLVDPASPTTAVCLKSGARLAVSNIPESIRSNFDLADVAAATFVQADSNHHHVAGFRDGVIFDRCPEYHFLFQELGSDNELTVEVLSVALQEEAASVELPSDTEPVYAFV